MSTRFWRNLILGLHLLLGVTYAVVTPVFEGGDELWHYPMVEHLSRGEPLPVQVFDPVAAGLWKQQASQPPLYYYVGAALTFWVDTSDLLEIRRLNPHVDNGIVTVDGNINLAVRDPSADPWQGTLLAVRIVRVFSTLLGTAAVLLTFLIARETVPDRPEIALGAMALHAFLPMFLFIGGAVNNDNLIIPLAALALLLTIRAVTRSPLTPGRVLLLGAVIGAAALAKISGVLLLPLAFGGFVIEAWRVLPRGSVRRAVPAIAVRSLSHTVLAALPAAAIAGWWYARNVQLYGDWRGWNAFIAVLGQRSHPASPAQLWDERVGFMQAYWGLFGGVNLPLWSWAYAVLNGVLIIGTVGFVIFLVGQFAPFARARRWPVRHIVANLFDWVAAHFGVVACLVWTLVIVAGLINWATTTWSSQGRLVFAALSAEMVLLAIGLGGWLPRRAARTMLGSVALFLFGVAAAAPWAIIRPAYQPVFDTALDRPEPSQTFMTPDGVPIHLVAFTASRTELAPGEPVDVAIQWVVDDAVTEDWSVFVHLNDPVVGAPLAQRDMYMAQGLRPTSLMPPGEPVTNRYRLTVPATAMTPNQLSLAVGLYNATSGERLRTTAGEDAVILADIPLRATAGAVPNPQAVNFGDTITLDGYAVTERAVTAGAATTVTLYVSTQTALTTDYSFTVQVIGQAATDITRWAAHDVAAPTSTWLPGDTQTLTLPLTVREDTPAGVYDIIVGVYTIEADGFRNLPLVTADGRITNDTLLRLTPLRVTE